MKKIKLLKQLFQFLLALSIFSLCFGVLSCQYSGISTNVSYANTLTITSVFFVAITLIGYFILAIVEVIKTKEVEKND